MHSQATHPTSARLLEAAIAAASAAASIIQSHTAHRSSVVWEEKSQSDFVSMVDLAAEARISEILHELVPEATVAGEERSPGLFRGDGIIFIVDPLDGTTNFLHGYPAYAVSIGAVRDGRLVAAVVHDVARGGVYTAVEGGGAWCGEERIHVSDITQPDRALIGTGIPFKYAADLQRYLPQLDRVARQTAGVRRAGSAALDLVDVARGRFEAFWELGLSPWDVAAGILIIREAGGVVTDLEGMDASPAHGPIVAGNPHMHGWLLEQLTLAGRDASPGHSDTVAAVLDTTPAVAPPRATPPAAAVTAASLVNVPVSHTKPGSARALIECIPNFSEGRRPEVIQAIARAIGDSAGTLVLDVSADRWHNRSVITFVAPPELVADAAFAGISEAARLIDLNFHVGAHPRLGAADVVPFVPLGNATMQDCVDVARALGERVGLQLDLPVYLYENAATSPARRNLADVRRGGFEGLRELIGVDPSRTPDFGPVRIHPTAGAVAIGARDLLVAFNVHLGPASNLPVVREIARAVRESSGGLPAVKALAMEVDGQAQLSMNLVDISRTPVHVVVERVIAEARARDVSVTWSEVVGLIPEHALQQAGAGALRIRDFTQRLLLDARLRDELP